jgi:integrase
MRPAIWLILDQGKQVTTGCAAEGREAAEHALAEYLVTKWEPSRRPISRIPIADPLALYGRDVAPGHARPRAGAQIIGRLLSFFGARMISTINGALCREYAATRPSASSSRRELEILQAALNHFHREGHMREHIRVWLPDKPAPRERWLTRSETARLLIMTWRHRERQGHVERHTRRHLCRFILIGIYLGRRASAICETKLGRSDDTAWVDLDNGTWNPRPGRKQTNKKQPAVRLPRRLLAHMRRWKAKGATWAVQYGRDDAGRDYHLNRPEHAFRAAVKAAGFHNDVKPHSMRHTAITWLMQAGADPWHVAGFVGISLTVLTRVYGHHHPDHLSTAVDALDRRRQQIANETRERNKHNAPRKRQKNRENPHARAS